MLVRLLLWSIALICCAEPVSARTVQIWYRGAQGCPEGNAFVERLSALGHSARLAGVGDAIDFVVSVGPAGEASIGRLEQQTEHGSMAIRELRAPHCAEVVEGLALSLDLALGPLHEDGAATQETEREASRWHVLLGAEGTLSTALAPGPTPGLALFAELFSAAAAPSARLALRGGASRGMGEYGVAVAVTVIAGRLDGCPWGWGSESIFVRPCLGLDLGVLRASSLAQTGQSAAGVWAAGSALGRLAWQPARAVRIELELGALLPFVRYELGADVGATVFQTGAVGLQGALGVAWQLP